ncbi:MAG: response regulator [Planctomycetota bacterium]
MSSGYDYRQHAVLYVDDEEKSLKYFTRALEEDFRILTASSAAEAEQVLSGEDVKVGVLVADQRMPGQTGVELLAGVRRSRPGIVRILTTAYSDLDSAIEAVNSGAIFRYVVKPWDIRELQGIMRSAMELFLVQRERDHLLREKMSVLQRLVESDRRRSFALIASIVGARLRNVPAAVEAFMEQSSGDADERSLEAAAVGNPGVWEEISERARDESRALLRTVRSAAETALEPPYDFPDSVSLQSLLDQALEDEDASAVEVDPGLPELRASAPMLQRMFRSLLRIAHELEPEGGAPSVRAERRDGDAEEPGVTVSITPSAPWDSQEVAALFRGEGVEGSDDACGDVLGAFLVAYHHGGRLFVRHEGEEAHAFEVCLPVDASAAEPIAPGEDWIAEAMTVQELWDVDSRRMLGT